MEKYCQGENSQFFLMHIHVLMLYTCRKCLSKLQSKLNIFKHFYKFLKLLKNSAINHIL